MHGSSDSLLVNILVVASGLFLVYLVKRFVGVVRAKQAKVTNAILDEADGLSQAGDYRQALEKTDEAIQSNIYVSPTAYFKKGTLHYVLGEKERALESYGIFLRKSPVGTESPEIDLARKRIKELGGDPEW